MFDHLTERAREVMRRSRMTALRWNHDHIAPEHLLLGILEEGSGTAASVLTSLHVDLAALREAVKERLVQGETVAHGRALPFTPESRAVLEAALAAADELGHAHIGTGHLLLGMIRDGGGPTAGVLARFGVRADGVRLHVRSSPGGERRSEGGGAARADAGAGTNEGGPGPEEEGVLGSLRALWRTTMTRSLEVLHPYMGLLVLLRPALKSQYRAALAMLREGIEACPAALWDREGDRNRTWQMAYHALFYAHVYMGRDQGVFEPWEHHQPGVQYLGEGPPDEGAEPRPAPRPYTKAQVLAYADVVDAFVEAAVDDLDPARGECGFPWYPMGKFEHALVNIRHIQHHAAALAERLRSSVDVGVKWVGRCHPGT